MENLSINFENSKDVIKKNMISRVESIQNATSEDILFEYLNNNNISFEEKKLISNQEIKKEKNFYSNIFSFFLSFLILFLLGCFLTFLSDAYTETKVLIIFFVFFGSLAISFFTMLLTIPELFGKYKYASPEELKDLYIKVFKDNISDYLPLNNEELKELYNSNEFIKAYVDNNTNEIFTRYSLNTAAGIKMNNLHMINEFKDVIDNNKILLGLPEGQKIVIENTINKEQTIF